MQHDGPVGADGQRMFVTGKGLAPGLGFYVIANFVGHCRNTSNRWITGDAIKQDDLQRTASLGQLFGHGCSTSRDIGSNNPKCYGYARRRCVAAFHVLN